MNDMRVLPVGDGALRIELEDRIDPRVNTRAAAIADGVQAASFRGVYDVVPAYRSVTVYFDPLRADLPALYAWIAGTRAKPSSGDPPPGDLVRIPVKYDGPDLAEVAAFSGLSEAEVVRLHAGATYRVFMMGFVPGFAYLGSVNRAIAIPRRDTPRLRVPAGAVGIAGEQTGVYPSETPGGWRLVGRTPARLFDHSRANPFLLKTGDSVKFEPIEDWPVAMTETSQRSAGASPTSARATIRVVTPGLLTTVQDCGRRGLQARGVPVSGPMDPLSHRWANLIVNNPDDAATLEITLTGPELEFEDERTVAVAGASFELSVAGTQPRCPSGAFVVPAGARLRFGARSGGARAYLAVQGGIASPKTLGSRATHVVTGLGGRPLVAGDRLPLGASAGGNSAPGSLRGARAPLQAARPAVLRVLPGPDTHRFSSEALPAVQSAPYVVGTDSDRMGYRLSGPRLAHAGTSDIISEATPLGALQVPSSGQPVLLMADRQTSGGYPILATVISADISVAGQLAPGDLVRFAVCTQREAVAALIAQERQFVAAQGAS